MDTNFIQKIAKGSVAKAVIAAAIIIAGTIIYLNYSGKSCSKDQISAQDAASKAIEYINKNILKGQATASLTGVTEENDLYKIEFTIKDQKIASYVSKNGKLLFPEISNAIDMSVVQPEAVQQTGTTVGNFSVSNNEVCREDDKPIIYFFGSKSCPHCVWEKPILEGVMAKFKDVVSFHENIDSDKDKDVFSKYSDGGIPTLVVGCKYYRVGSGESAGQDAEIKALTALICKLTDNNPNDVCNSVQDTINQIK